MPDAALIAILRPPGEPEAPPFRVVFERLHRVRRKAGHQVPAHVHAHAEVMLPTLGRYGAVIEGAPLVVPAGGALLVAPGDRHEDASPRAVGFFSVSLRIEPGPAPGRSRPLLAPGAPAAARILAAAPELHAVAQRLLDDGQPADACAVRVQDALAGELLWRLLARLPRAALAEDLLPAVERADFAAAFAAVCGRHLQGRPDAAALARDLGIAERTLSARCRRLLGDAPVKLFRRRQMLHARSLLLNSAMGVAAVARHLGFANPFHFSAVYRRVHGHPPSHAGSDMPPAGSGMMQRGGQRAHSPP